MLPFELMVLGFAQLALTTQTPTYPADGSDLFSFVSRPDIRAPRFNVSVYKPDLVTPGYWFTAPYGDLRSRLPTTLYQPGQVGPHIYDGYGELVWSGAHLFDDRPTFDFKVAEYGGEQHLTFVTNEDLHETDSPGGSAIILDNAYQRIREIEDRAGRGTMNMHEYSTIDSGRRALTITFESKLADLTVDGETQKMFTGNNGFSEIETETGEPIFSWWALDHIDPTESLVEQPSGPGSYGSPWDAYHINSVDKNAEGDYLISARYTNTIYKISGRDGRIIWRLGGSESDFELRGFNMSSQHDARFKSNNDTTVVLTFFNNHSDGHHATAHTSAAMEVELDLTTMKAHVLKQWDRPDGGLTKLRGNAQRLPNDNMFICWSENSYMSENTADGELVMEAQMASHRLVSYRAYKMNFTAQPSEPIAVKVFVFGIDESSSTTVTYVSWNGATEVKEWRFYGRNVGASNHIGTTAKTGFETTFMASGSHRSVVVEALDAEGNVLGTSAVSEAEIPSFWASKIASEIMESTSAGGLASAPDATDTDKMSVSEDLSAEIHRVAADDLAAEDAVGDSFEGVAVILTNPLFLFGMAAMAAAVTAVVVVRRARRGHWRSVDLGRYKMVSDDV